MVAEMIGLQVHIVFAEERIKLGGACCLEFDVFSGPLDVADIHEPLWVSVSKHVCACCCWNGTYDIMHLFLQTVAAEFVLLAFETLWWPAVVWARSIWLPVFLFSWGYWHGLFWLVVGLVVVAVVVLGHGLNWHFRNSKKGQTDNSVDDVWCLMA